MFTKKAGFLALSIAGILNALIGSHEISTAFFITAFLYDAIKQDDKP